MATSQDVIDRATSILKVRASGQTYLQDDSSRNADLFVALQNLIAEWGEDGVLNIPAPSAVDSNLDVPPGTIRALAANLATEVAGDFGVKLQPKAFEVAQTSLDRLQSEITIDISVDMSDLAFTHKYDIRGDR